MNNNVDYLYILERGFQDVTPEQLENDYLEKAKLATKEGEVVTIPRDIRVPTVIEKSDIVLSNGTVYQKVTVVNEAERGEAYEMYCYSFEDNGFTFVTERKHYDGNELVGQSSNGFGINPDGTVHTLKQCVVNNVIQTVEEVFDNAQQVTATPVDAAVQ